MRRFLQHFGPYCKDYLGRFVIASLGVGMVALATAAIAYLIKPVLDDIFVAKDREMLKLLPPLVIAAFLTLGFGRYIQMYHTAYIGEDIIRRIRDRLLRNLLALDLAFFNKRRGGELISRTTNDIARIRLAVSQYLAVVVRESLVIVALIGVVIYHSPRLAFYALVVLPLAAYPLVWLARRMKRLSHRSQEKDSDITSRLAEIFNNIEIIKAHSSEGYESGSFERDNLEFFTINMKGVRIRELVSPLMEGIGAIGGALVIVLGGSLVIDGELSVGTFFSFSTSLFLLYTPVKRISVIYNKMFDAVAASERIFEMIERKSSIVSGDMQLEGPVLSLEFDDVRLRYDQTQALDGVSLTVAKGETVALVGGSGGGKTSLVNLILRLYDPTGGTVRVNGIDIRSLTIDSLRSRIGIVTQRIFIFNDTVAANVAYGSKIDPDRVTQALHQAGAWEFISELEDGIDSLIDEFGANLSGGQRQRLAIARAIYKDPDILILDEATSALDNRSEAAIQQSLETLLRNKITFVIAHRLSTVELADRILVVDCGRLVGSGSKQELLASCSEYRQLAEPNATVLEQD